MDQDHSRSALDQAGLPIERDSVLAGLKDPASVHALMLRGLIAWPSWRALVDLRGEVPNGEEAQLLRIAQLQEEVAVLKGENGTSEARGERFSWSDEKNGFIQDGQWQLSTNEVVRELNGRGLVNQFKLHAWPQSKDVARIGDMSPTTALRVGLDSENDVYVGVTSALREGIEFCTPGSGGGKSRRTRLALIALMVAMEADNAEDASRDWWARRNGTAPQPGAQE